ncbi:MAG: hypothetical protein J0H63_04910 [Rhizobiales bacterium]|nr:hypothetical protein [Hyphomicrobiales bacterium]MBN9009490.1 hypothetical protein [Hyphomicrobiales bacterium]
MRQTPTEPFRVPPSYLRDIATTEIFMRGILLWLLGIPIPIIILLYLFHVV